MSIKPKFKFERLLAVILLHFGFFGTMMAQARESVDFQSFITAYLYYYENIDQNVSITAGLVGVDNHVIATTVVVGTGIGIDTVLKPPRAIDRFSDRATTFVPTSTLVSGFVGLAAHDFVRDRKKFRYDLLAPVSKSFREGDFLEFFEHLEQGWRLKSLLGAHFPDRSSPEITFLVSLLAKLPKGPIPKLYGAKHANRILDLTAAHLVAARLRATSIGPEALGRFEEEWKKYEATLEDGSDPKQTLKLLDAILLRMENIEKEKVKRPESREHENQSAGEGRDH